jgi:hypothetical protein
MNDFSKTELKFTIERQHGGTAEFDGYQLVVTAEDGIRITNTVYLDPHSRRLCHGEIT